MINKNYCLQSDIVKVSYQFQLLSLYCFVVVCQGIGMVRPFVVYMEIFIHYNVKTYTLGA